MNGATFILPLVMGLGIASHGAQKLFGWFGGGGIRGTGAFFESIGFRPGNPFALAALTARLSRRMKCARGLHGPSGTWSGNKDERSWSQY
jgi:putative oxidoreductase